MITKENRVHLLLLFLLLLLLLGGDVYGWGTNSMGQCGQGHNNNSISKPGKVEGLDGVQVQQISAGTSHSIVWTAIPNDRYVHQYMYYCYSNRMLYLHVLMLCRKFEPIPT